MIDLNKYPCPICNKHKLVDDGIVRWRSGKQPPRFMAKPRNQLGTSPRADYDETALYHCASCKKKFVDRTASRYNLKILHTEGWMRRSYRFDRKTNTWKPW